jgi:hypothetical protein
LFLIHYSLHFHLHPSQILPIVSDSASVIVTGTSSCQAINHHVPLTGFPLPVMAPQLTSVGCGGTCGCTPHLQGPPPPRGYCWLPPNRKSHFIE